MAIETSEQFRGGEDRTIWKPNCGGHAQSLLRKYASTKGSFFARCLRKAIRIEQTDVVGEGLVLHELCGELSSDRRKAQAHHGVARCDD